MFVDTKAFKGKGAAAAARAWANDARRRLRAHHDAMEQLKIESKKVPGRQYALETYRRTEKGECTLRWRMATAKHVTWPVIAPHVAAMPKSMRDFYLDLQQTAIAMNAIEQCLRHELSRAEALERALRQSRSDMEGASDEGRSKKR